MRRFLAATAHHHQLTGYGRLRSALFVGLLLPLDRLACDRRWGLRPMLMLDWCLWLANGRKRRWGHERRSTLVIVRSRHRLSEAAKVV